MRAFFWVAFLFVVCLFVVPVSAQDSSDNPLLTNKRLQSLDVHRIYSKSLDVLLPYRTPDVDGAQIVKVDLYYTTNEAYGTWTLCGSSNDKEGKLIFTAPGFGIYGMKWVSTDEAGNVGDPITPQAVVIVDSTAPQATLSTNPPDGSDVEPDTKIDLQWSVTDDYLGETPATVQVSMDQGTTWETLYENMPPQGAKTYWIAQDRSKPKKYPLHFQVVVKDLAGNEGVGAMNRGFMVNRDNTALPPDVGTVIGPDAGQEIPEVPYNLDNIANTVSKQNFNINYSLKNVGESGVRAVHIYYTTDNGRTWTYAGADADKESPFEFKAPKDGVYGFYIIVENNADVKDKNRPQSGIRPRQETLTLVDSVHPSVALRSPRGGEFWKAGNNYITYEISDDFLKEINLYYSTDGGETWQTLEKNIRNTGQYLWLTEDMNHGALMVKIEAIDRAGNVSIDRTEKSFAIDKKSPVVEFIGVEPANTGTGNPDGGGENHGHTDMPSYKEQAKLSYEKGVLYRHRREWAKAAECFNQSTDLDRDNANAHYELGYALLRQGEHASAIESMRQALALDSENPVYYAGLAKAHEQLQDWSSALICLAEVTNRLPKTAGSLAVDALWEMGKIYAAQKDYVSAVRVYQEIAAIKEPASEYRDHCLKYIEQYQPLVEEQLEREERERESARQ